VFRVCGSLGGCRSDGGQSPRQPEKKVIGFSTEALPHFIGWINMFHSRVYHRDIGTAASLLAAQRGYPAIVVGPGRS